MIFVKMYGLPRSGTNYIQNLIQNNYEDIYTLKNILGWKHGLPCEHRPIDWKCHNWDNPHEPIYAINSLYKEYLNIKTELDSSINTGGVRYVYVIKNILDWCNSYIRFNNSITNVKQYDEKKIIDTLNIYYRYNNEYIKHSKEKYSIFIKYEELIDNFDDSMVRLKNELYLTQLNDKYTNIDKSVNPNNKLLDDNYSKKDYIISEQQIEWIKKHTNTDIISVFGY